jgi:hypothetical protein
VETGFAEIHREEQDKHQQLVAVLQDQGELQLALAAAIKRKTRLSCIINENLPMAATSL